MYDWVMMQTFKKQFRTSDGVSLYYELSIIENRQPSVLLIHGAGGDLDAWEYIKNNLLAAGISSVAMDLRGHGYSGHPRGFKQYSIERLAADICELLATERITTIAVAGHSYGAVVALQFAINYPERVSRLVVISGTYRPPQYLSSKTRVMLSEFATKALALISPPPINPGHSTYPPGKVHRDYEFFGLMRTILRNSWRSYLLTSKEAITLSIKEKLSRIRIPTLVIVGEQDSIFPMDISRTIHEEIASSEFAVIPGGTHVVILNNVPEVSALLLAFLPSEG